MLYIDEIAKLSSCRIAQLGYICMVWNWGTVTCLTTKKLLIFFEKLQYDLGGFVIA